MEPLPIRWAEVWAVRLKHYAADEQCRYMFRRGLTDPATAAALREAMPPELFESALEAAVAGSPKDLLGIADRLREWRFAKLHRSDSEPDP